MNDSNARHFIHLANSRAAEIQHLDKKLIDQQVQIELLKANLRTVAEQLRSGVSKTQQKTLARVIEEMLRSER